MFYALSFKKLLLYAVLLLLLSILLANPEGVMEALQNAMLLCYRTVIPSLFPFFVLSGILTGSGFDRVLEKVFSPVMKPLFRTGGASALPFGIGIMSGYPTGAKATLELYEKGAISRSEAERLLPFCNNSGPLFVIGAIGIGLLQSHSLGIYLYLVHILSALCVGLCFRFYPGRESLSAKLPTATPNGKSIAQLVPDAVRIGTSQILTVCGFILFFSALSACLGPIFDRFLPALFSLSAKALLELTVGAQAVSTYGFSLPAALVFISFLLGFGGICVHLQVAGILSGSGLALMPYFLGKILHGFLAALLSFLTLPLLPDDVFLAGPESLPTVSLLSDFPDPGPYGPIISIFFLIILLINYKKIIAR
ncbi:MAG: sporulation protein [Clostridia bacterium]|nr:sporulation protein [Clostridia bacterium]